MVHNLRVQSIMTGMSPQQELETRAANVSVWSTFTFLFNKGSQPMNGATNI